MEVTLLQVWLKDPENAIGIPNRKLNVSFRRDCRSRIDWVTLKERASHRVENLILACEPIHTVIDQGAVKVALHTATAVCRQWVPNRLK
jgi:hypothetical protein